jgi:hypothetical protein
MKQKDLVYLLLAVVIFLVAGYVGYTQLVPKKTGASSVVQVEKIGLIPAEMDQAGLTALNDPTRVKDYSSPVDLGGLGNTAPFGP